MGYCRQTSLPAQEPVSLDMAKRFMNLPASFVSQDDLITGWITAAREKGEILTWRSLAKRNFTQVLDSFPYFTDTVQSQLAYPPSYYSLPRYSTTLWNYSQMIKLGYSPAISVTRMRYVGSDGNYHTLNQDVDFILDRIAEPSRIFPPPGQYWPASLYVANACQIDYVAGYDPDPSAIDVHSPPISSPPMQQPDSTIVSGVPQMIILGILNLVAWWFNNRGAVGEVPDNIAQIFLNWAINDFQPTRG